MVAASAPTNPGVVSYASALAKTQSDIAELRSIVARNRLDPEKRVRLAYRQYHLASLTTAEDDYESVRRTIAGVIADFGPKEDICLLKASVDGHFHRLDDIKQDLQLCPGLARRPAARLISADIDFQEGRYPEARTAIEALIEEERTWDALARLAYWHGKMGNVTAADRLYEEASNELTAKEMSSYAWLELQRGKLALSRGARDRARSHFQRAEASFPGHWSTDAHWAGLLAAEGRLNEAVELLEDVVSRAPKPELKQAIGEVLSLMGRDEEAGPYLEAARKQFLDSVGKGGVHYFHHLADFYADVGGDPAQAVEWARKDVALRSNFATQSALAWALHQAGEAREGLKWIDDALSSGVQDSGIFATAAALCLADGDAERSENFKRKADAINPNEHGIHLHVVSF